MACGINYEILAFSKHYRTSAFLNLGITAASLFINYYSILWFGFVGASIGTIFIVILFNIVRGGFLWQKMGLQPFHKNAFFVLILAAFIAIIEHFCPHFTNTRLSAFLDACTHCALIGGFYLIILLKFNLSDDISNSFQKNWKQFRAK
jgi:O-antigen/teichoic acid export membrane protein